MREILEDNIKLRDKTESRFQAFFDKELNRLKNDFRNESEVGTTQTARPYPSTTLLTVMLCVSPIPTTCYRCGRERTTRS